MTIIAHFSDKITLHRKYAPGEYEEEVYYNIYVPSASDHSRRSTGTLCRRNVLITMLFNIQNMFHSEIRIKLGNKNTTFPQFLPVLWYSCVLYRSWRPRPQLRCTGNGKELFFHFTWSHEIIQHQLHQNCNISMWLCNVQCDIVINLRCPHRQQSHWKCEGAVKPYAGPCVTSHQMHRDLNQTPSKFCLFTHHLQFSISQNTLFLSDCGKRLTKIE